MAKQTRETIQQRLADSRGLRMLGSDLRGIDLSRMNLQDADLRFSNLEDINFSHTNLKGADLSFSSLNRSNFEGANLEKANLSFCGLADTDFTNAILTNANLSFSGGRQSNRKQQVAQITHLLYHTGWLGRLAGLIIGAFMVYGISGIIYFTNELATTQNPVVYVINQYVLVNNVVAGMGVVLLTYLLTGVLDKNIKQVWLQHGVLSVVVFVCYTIYNTVVYLLILKKLIDSTLLQKYPETQVESAPWYMFAIGPILVANIFYFFQRQGQQLTRKISEQEYQLLQMEGLKTKAELEALEAKINPHFLYNALNSIASLVHLDPDKAERMTMLLSKFFRYATSKKDQYYDSVASELEIVQTYLEVEKVRFDERLTYSIDIQEEKLKEAKIPRFIIQPLVENAIKHAVSKMAGQGEIKIEISQETNLLQIRLFDNGVAFPEPLNAGYGLQSIQDKLRLLCGENASLELLNTPYKHVCLQMPLLYEIPEKKG